MTFLNILINIWSLWVSFGLPITLFRKLRAVLQDPETSETFRKGSILFYCGIFVWCPFVLFRRLLGVPVPLPPVLVTHLICLYSGLYLRKRGRVPKELPSENG